MRLSTLIAKIEDRAVLVANEISVDKAKFAARNVAGLTKEATTKARARTSSLLARLATKLAP